MTNVMHYRFGQSARVLILLTAISPAIYPQTTMFPQVRGTHEMVGAGNNFEVEAGYRILTQGGNAVDAGVAAILTAGVTEQDHFGLGGEMPALIKMANAKEPVVINAVGVAPALATVERYKQRKPEPWEKTELPPPIPKQGILAALTPGVVSGLLIALRDYGTMSFAQVAQPAIGYADGFPITGIYVTYLQRNQPLLALWPTSMKFFLPDGKPPQAGSLYHSPMLAKTLRAMAETELKAAGTRKQKLQAVHEYFFKGPIAKEIARFSEAEGGLIRYSDLANYSAAVEAPKVANYRGYQIYKPGFWTQGPVMIEALNILEGIDLKALGHNTPDYLHVVIETVKLAFADRDAYYGDPQFTKIPESTLLSKEYATERRKQINLFKASLESRPGKLTESTASGTIASMHPPVQDTTCVNVVDRMGNVFSATPSGAWLPSVIAGETGIPLSVRMESFVLTDGHPNQLAPGKRPRVTLSPTIVLKDGKPVIALSTPGADNQDQALLQVLLNLLEFDMSPQEAVEAPRFQTEHFYSSFDFHEFVPGKLNLEGRFRPATIEGMKRLGHDVTVAGDWSNTSAPTVIQIKDGVLSGGADPRRGRFIFGR